MNKYKRKKSAELAGRASCEYEYQVGKCKNYRWVLIKQPVLDYIHEYIGLRTEKIASEIYFSDLSGVDPNIIRFVEYYPPVNFPGGIFPNGFAEQRLDTAYTTPNIVAKALGAKPKFLGYVGTPSACSPPFNSFHEGEEFFNNRSIII